MISTGRVAIRPLLPLRLYSAGFLIFWFVAVLWTVIRHPDLPVIVVGVILEIAGCGMAYWLLRQSVQSKPHGILRVYNFFGTRNLARSQIEEFRIGDSGGRRVGQKSVQALLSDGTTFGLDVCRAPIGVGTSRLARQLDQLNAWLHAED